MTICGSQSCSCGLVSNSLTVTGSGAAGSPFQIETLQGQVVTSGTRPGSPTNGMGIYETDTQRSLIYNGTSWVIVGGDWPRFKIEAQSAQSIADGAGGAVTPALGTEVIDTDAFHTGTNGFVTIPATLGGDYVVIVHGVWAANATGNRYIQATVGNNAGAPTQNGNRRNGGYVMANTVNNGQPSTMFVRLAAAATVTASVLQLSGGALNLNQCSLEGYMVRHLPALV